MSQSEVIVEGTLKADGTLELDQRPSLAPGRVTVVLRQQTIPELPKDDPFWQRMQAVWDAQRAAGHPPRSVEQIAAEQRQLRDEWEERQQALERLQEECRMARQSQEGPRE